MGFFDFVTMPTSFRNAQALKSVSARDHVSFTQQAVAALSERPPMHSQHPSVAHLTLLVFEAVLEVVCVSLPGYIVARMGMFDAESQKFVANLNVTLFTPCLVFTKLASQLTAEKLIDLAIIPFIFIVQIIISYLCAIAVSKCFGFKQRQRNFVIAMGVFGNSNSLPISLVISLSKTLKGLHWDKVPNDNDDEVEARGILYLLIFQQLGQLLRWSWGYNVLLAPADKYAEANGGTDSSRRLEQGHGDFSYVSEDDPHQRLIGSVYDGEYDTDYTDDEATTVVHSPAAGLKGHTPARSSRSTSRSRKSTSTNHPDLLVTSANGDITPRQNGHLVSALSSLQAQKNAEASGGFEGSFRRIKHSLLNTKAKAGDFFASKSRAIFASLPSPIQTVLSKTYKGIVRFMAGLWEFMNPPLWAMLIAIVVASVPTLQRLFFDDGTFIRNSVTRAISQSGGVAVPLILVVLGANLARNTLPKEMSGDLADPKEERNLLIASLISRMVLPTIIMAPLLAVTAKFIPVSIVDDKIFIIVCFLLTGAPSALQLAQICQVNNVYMGVMSNILFQSYVVYILPSTLILVMLALETVEWADY